MRGGGSGGRCLLAARASCAHGSSGYTPPSSSSPLPPVLSGWREDSGVPEPLIPTVTLLASPPLTPVGGVSGGLDPGSARVLKASRQASVAPSLCAAAKVLSHFVGKAPSTSSKILATATWPGWRAVIATPPAYGRGPSKQTPLPSTALASTANRKIGGP